MDKAIQKAIEGGYEDVARDCDGDRFEHLLLDPLFWQALGKSLGWKQTTVNHIFWTKETDEKKVHTIQRWENEWHNFISHLAEGKSADEFFNNLLK